MAPLPPRLRIWGGSLRGRGLDQLLGAAEGPRSGGHKIKPGRPPRDRESVPKRDAIGAHCRFDPRELSENFAPLIRYLRSHVGTSWDEVCSDVSRHLRPTNAVQQHVRDHLLQFVELHPRFAAGVPENIHGHSVRFYVCPNTGALCEHVPPRRGRARKVASLRGCSCKDCRQLTHR